MNFYKCIFHFPLVGRSPLVMPSNVTEKSELTSGIRANPGFSDKNAHYKLPYPPVTPKRNGARRCF